MTNPDDRKDSWRSHGVSANTRFLNDAGAIQVALKGPTAILSIHHRLVSYGLRHPSPSGNLRSTSPNYLIPAVRLTLSSIHPSNLPRSLGSNQILKGLGCVTILVGTALHSIVSSSGNIPFSVVDLILKARMMRLKMAYNSRFARWAPAQLRVPAP